MADWGPGLQPPPRTPSASEEATFTGNSCGLMYHTLRPRALLARGFHPGGVWGGMSWNPDTAFLGFQTELAWRATEMTQMCQALTLQSDKVLTRLHPVSLDSASRPKWAGCHPEKCHPNAFVYLCSEAYDKDERRRTKETHPFTS